MTAHLRLSCLASLAALAGSLPPLLVGRVVAGSLLGVECADRIHVESVILATGSIGNKGLP